MRPDAASDGGDGSASPDDDASGARGPNLHGFGTFESGCDPWAPFGASAEASGDAHTGSGACRVCALGSSDFTLDDEGFLASPAPGRYRARAWIRTAPGSAAPPFVGLILRTVNRPTDSEVQEIEKAANDGAVSDDWQPASVELDVTLPAEALNVVVYSESHTCLIVDDVTVERLP
jgi:hypothetical protein